MEELRIRLATLHDIEDVLSIYNEGIEDRVATLETETKDLTYMLNWFQNHQNRYPVIVVERLGEITGWASLNKYNTRKAYDGVADLSVYIKRTLRGKGIGGKLLSVLKHMQKKMIFIKLFFQLFLLTN